MTSPVHPPLPAGVEPPSDHAAPATPALAELSAESGNALAVAGARIHAQLPGPAAVAVGERGPVVVVAAEQAEVDLAAALDDYPGLGPGAEREVTGELTVVRPHPDLESRCILQPRAEGARWRALTVQRREG